jgi:hypothetical protein
LCRRETLPLANGFRKNSGVKRWAGLGWPSAIGAIFWRRLWSGGWSQDRYHSGHIASYIARVGSLWILDSVVRNAELDESRSPKSLELIVVQTSFFNVLVGHG